jgi:stage II sporulation protein M
MAFGLVIGLFPLFFILTNGMVIGIMLELMIVKYGVAYGTFIFLVGIMPHGIFELPAIFISTSIGLKLGYEVMRTIFLRKTDMVLELRNALMIFIFWILPMLLVAALIETFVTGALLSLIVHTPV